MMNVVFTSSISYYKYMMVTIDSLFLYEDPTSIHIYVITERKFPDLQKKISRYIQSRGSKISFIVPNEQLFINFKHTKSSRATHSKFIYSRLFLNKILPKNIDRCILFGADVFIRNSIDEFYNADFEDKAIVACYDTNAFRNIVVHKNLDWEGNAGRGKSFFNDDVVLFNLDKFRELNISENTYNEYIFSYCPYNSTQGLLNWLLCVKNNLVKYLPPYIYNSFPIVHELFEQYGKDNGIIIDPKIVQFVVNRPWDSFFNNSLSYYDEWWNIAKQSLLYPEILEEVLVDQYLNKIKTIPTDRKSTRLNSDLTIQ